VTDLEKEIVDDLAGVWNKYLLLEENSSINVEFCQGVHVLQNIVLSRAAIRNFY
jgi:hypothetical protein